MNEAEWMAFTDPRPMLSPLRRGASDRKLRLFAAACCRRIWDLLPDQQCRSALETAERFADGLASLEPLREAHQGAMLSYVNYDDHDECGRFTGRESAAMAVAGACWTEEEGQDRGLDDVVDNCYGLTASRPAGGTAAGSNSFASAAISVTSSAIPRAPWSWRLLRSRPR